MKSMYRIGLVLIPVGAILALATNVTSSLQGRYSADPDIGLGLLFLLGLALSIVGVCLALIARHGMRNENATTTP